MGTGLTWLLFIFTSAIIVVAGHRMTIYGDVIGDRSPLGYTWVGTILLASVTSLPELVTAFTVSTLGEADIVIGNIFGSNNFNMLIIFIIDIILIVPILNRVEKSHSVNGIFAIILSQIVMFSLAFQWLIGRDNLGFYAKLPVGLDSILIFAGYIYAMYYIFKQSKAETTKAAQKIEDKYAHISTRMAYIKYSAYALIIVTSGIFMGILGARLANAPVELFGMSITLGGTLMGTLFFAITTSLPELVVTISAVKLKSYDMALGNVMGSNLFNLAIIGMADIFFLKGPILIHADFRQLITITISIIMVGIAVYGIKQDKEKPIFKRLTTPTLLLLIVYTIGFIILWKANLIVN